MSKPIRVNVKTIDEIRQSLQTLEQNRLSSPKSNTTASAPTVNDDMTLGYSVFSLWVDTAASDVYQLIDPTVGAANWVNLTSGGFVGAGKAFRDIVCPNADNPQAEVQADTLTLLAGNTAIVIAGSAAADSVTFTIDGDNLHFFV